MDRSAVLASVFFALAALGIVYLVFVVRADVYAAAHAKATCFKNGFEEARMVGDEWFCVRPITYPAKAVKELEASK